MKICDIPIAIIGAGNIGSNTAIALTRMGMLNITIFDDDVVENHNLSSQAYKESHDGVKKVEALVEILQEVNGATRAVGVDRLIDGTELSDRYKLIISAVDGLVARREIASGLAEETPHDTIVLDGRMGGTQIEVHKTTVKDWASIIPEKADSDPCSARYISFTVYGIAGLMADMVRKIYTEKEVPESFVFDYESLAMHKQ